MSGSVDARLPEVTASTRSRPVCTCGMAASGVVISSCTRPAIRSWIAGPPPLYGIWLKDTPAMLPNSMPARCGPEPMPVLASASSPGFAFASAIRSRVFFAAEFAGTTSTNGLRSTSMIGVKSRPVS